MSETKEIILNSLGVLCREYPEQRFGQILYNYLLSHCNDNDTFYLEDEKILEILEQELKEISH